MMLYHGTSNSAYLKIVESKYLRPRGNSRGTWHVNNAPSHPDLVYFTKRKDLAEFYGMHASMIDFDDRVVVLGFDSDELEEDNFRVDETWYRKGWTSIEEGNRQVVKAFTDTRWKQSLEESNYCSHKGAISLRHVVHVELIHCSRIKYFIPQLLEGDTGDERDKLVKTLIDNNIFNHVTGRWEGK